MSERSTHRDHDSRRGSRIPRESHPVSDISVSKRPRVVLLTSPSLMGARVIEAYDREPGVELAGIGLTNRVFKNTGLVGTVRRILRRSGWSYFFYSVMESTVAWNRLRAKRLPAALARSDVSVLPIVDINGVEALQWMRDLRPDFVVSFFFNQWIGAEVRAVPSRRCVNVHPSLLPALRGPDPVFRAMEKGLVESGVTLHEVADEFDSGGVLDQAARPFDTTRSHFHNLWELVSFGADWSARLVAEGLPLENRNPGGAAPITPTEKGDYASFPSTLEVRRFLRGGHRLYTWSEWRAAMNSLAERRQAD